jgi:mono/diheme cytochrome c family protein
LEEEEKVRHKNWLMVAIVSVLIIIVGAYTVMHVNISALPEPGPVETSFATKAKGWYISRAARGSLPPAPTKDASSLSTGETLFGMGCATCHGQDGHKPTPIGKSMYPRVLDLGSPEVQEMSDRELFWVIKNGIRLSGMPGFAKIESDEQIWELAYYVRSLGKQPKR